MFNQARLIAGDQFFNVRWNSHAFAKDVQIDQDAAVEHWPISVAELIHERSLDAAIGESAVHVPSLYSLEMLTLCLLSLNFYVRKPLFENYSSMDKFSRDILPVHGL
ncbi:hypothetical protein [Herminiimonas fonticola]|uniref:hypothetical protein n=1 Tax=Herminiimonas fonticola TaxID=303380 RepID=UPI00333EE37C